MHLKRSYIDRRGREKFQVDIYGEGPLNTELVDIIEQNYRILFVSRPYRS